jgi:hypothetical protein
VFPESSVFQGKNGNRQSWVKIKFEYSIYFLQMTTTGWENKWL